MITIHSIDSTEAVRALSEHRAPKRFLLTTPWQPDQPTTRPAPAECELPPIEPGPDARGRSDLKGTFARFKSYLSIVGPEFTVLSFFEFALRHKCHTCLSSVTTFFTRMHRAGTIQPVRRESKYFIWKLVKGGRS